MPFDANNYVEALPNGQYQAVVNGVPQGAMSQQQAEQTYNQQTQGSSGGNGGGSAGGGGFYQTREGPKTLQQMQSELQAAGWGGNYSDANAVFAAYQGVGSGGGGAGGVGNFDYMNVAAEQLRLQAAAQAAQQAYQQKRLELIDLPMLQIEKDRLAMQAAQQAANIALSEGSLTGYYQPVTVEYVPGQNGAAGTFKVTPTGERQKTLPRDQFDESKRQFDTNIGMQGLNLLANMRGPRNAFQQQNVMSGLNELGLSKAVDAVAGRFSMPSFQANQAAPQRVSFQTMADDLRYASGQRAYNQPQQGGGDPTEAMLFEHGGSGATRTPGADPSQAVYGPVSTPNFSTMPVGGQVGYQAPGTQPGAGAPVNTQAYVKALPAPNKIVGREFFGLPQDTQEFMLSAYEEAGYSPTQVVEGARRASMPKFAAPKAGTLM
jgi:hypothetical protein